jgi:hypothetical protein
MTPVREDDFPPGHPARFDYKPESPEAQEWARLNIHPKGERDFPVDHPKAIDTPGNKNAQEWRPGVDPDRPELEPHSGRTPEQVEAMRKLYEERKQGVKETVLPDPVEAPAPPTPGSIQLPTGQPGK